jgi:DNA-binding NarL/FixJ family response regulator
MTELERQRRESHDLNLLTGLSSVALAGLLLAVNLGGVTKLLMLVADAATASLVSIALFAIFWLTWLVFALRFAVSGASTYHTKIPERNLLSPHKRQAARSSVRVIVVKSADEDVDDLMTYMLRRSELDVVGPVLPDQALAIARSYASAVVVADTDVPDVDAFAFTTQITSDLPRTAVVLIGSQTGASTRQRAARSGATALLSKPWSSLELVNAILDAGRSAAHGQHSSLSQGFASRNSIGLRLTEREREILTLIAEGITSREMAKALGVTTNTVSRHVATIMAKLGTNNRDAAIAAAVSAGLRAEPEQHPN